MSFKVDESRVRLALQGPSGEVLRLLALQPIKGSGKPLGQPVPVTRCATH